jgi:hypothetical protein
MLVEGISKRRLVCTGSGISFYSSHWRRRLRLPSGRRSEKMDADQLQLLLSGNEASIVAGAANENAAADGVRAAPTSHPHRTGLHQAGWRN